MQTLGNTGEFPLGAVTFNIMSETPGRKVRDTFIFFPTATSKYLGSLQGGSHPHCPPSWLSAARISQHPAAGTAAPGFRPPPLPPPRAHEGLAPATSASGPPAQQQRCPHPAPRRFPSQRGSPRGHGHQGDPPPPRGPTWQGSSAVPGSSRRAILQKMHCCPSAPPPPGSFPSAPSCPAPAPAPAAASSPAIAARPPPGASPRPRRGLPAGPAASPWRARGALRQLWASVWLGRKNTQALGQSKKGTYKNVQQGVQSSDSSSQGGQEEEERLNRPS